MRLVEIRQELELMALQSAWDTLLAESGSDTVFLSWQWLSCWWATYGRDGEMYVLAAYDDNGVLRGIAPLRHGTARRYGRTVPTLSFLGDGSNDSDYLDFIVSPGWEAPVWEAFRGGLERELSRGVVLLLNEIPETSPHLPFLQRLAESPSLVSATEDIPCGTVPLPGSWEEYLATLRPRFRTKLRSVLRNLESRPEVRFGFCETPEQVERLLPVLFDLHTRRWAQDGKPGVFGWDQKRNFYFKMSSRLLELGWLRFSWLEWNGTVLACQYGFAYHGTYSQLQEGYEPTSDSWNVGIGLRAWSIREFIHQGLREYDFLGGMGRHKSDWGANLKTGKRLLIGRNSLTNRVFCRGPEWEAKLRESVAAILPEKLLAYRRTRLERQNRKASPNSGAAEPTSAAWVQTVASRCYFYTGMPAIARPLREKYQLSVSSNGRRPTMSLRRRTAPAGRILYYHRVNDERDPYFPATPVDVFEREMRYVAQHYKVVSLKALLEHLDSNSTETLFAITFDDGYRDNYTNALPILSRYGLPATIFLTTGCMDFEEPMWFEQLANAVKNTDRKFVDLETDVPRRLGLGTQAERLEAGGQIFGALRTLDDSSRRWWLAKILDQLAVPAGKSRLGRMLTWDQVRQMTRHQIDFGGHTVSHPFLSKLAGEQAEWEVSECKRRIEQELQRPVAHFAYPNGREEDFTAGNKHVIRNAGYSAAVSTIWGMNHPSTDRLELRRGGPWESNPAMFAYKLDWYQFVNG